jgi:hypothetical protein
MSFSADDLEKLEKAIKSGVRRVKFADREVEYHSLADMIKARDLLRRELGKTGGRTFELAVFDKGAK